MTDDLAAIGKKLSYASDAMNAAIEKAEEAIRSLHLGVPAKITISDGRILAWLKRNGTWGLFTTSETGTDAEPLRSASRSRRHEAVWKLIELINIMRTNALNEIAQVEAAQVELKSFTADVIAGAPPITSQGLTPQVPTKI